MLMHGPGDAPLAWEVGSLVNGEPGVSHPYAYGDARYTDMPVFQA